MLTHPPYENHIVPENIPLDIVYEDDTLLLINKQPGMVVHPWKLYRDFSACLGISFDNLPMNSSPGLVHRIDKDTSGLLIAKKLQR
jgi:23S rRNA pseudouridine1911/1915/1917 synthase